MKPQTKAPAPSGFGVHDVIYILFKHKWKIILLSLLGFGAAGGLAYRASLAPSYETTADLLVRYVVQSNVADPDAPNASRGSRGAIEVMNTELSILNSSNVALDAAKALGPEKVVPAGLTPPTLGNAAVYLLRNLTVTAERGSSVIHVSYRDSDPQRAVEILNQVIRSYFARHLAIHRSTTAFDQVSAQADQARSTLRITEEEINKLKAKSGVISIEGTTAEFEMRRQLARAGLMSAQASLAEQRAKVAAMEKGSTPLSSTTDQAAGAGAAATEIAATPEEQEHRRETAAALAKYQDLTARLDLLRQERNRILLRRSASDPMVGSLDRQIKTVEAEKWEITAKYADFSRRVEATGQPTGPITTLEDEKALLAALEARVSTSEAQAKAIESEVEGLSGLGFKLQELERRRQMEEEKYRHFQTSLEKARVDETLDPTRMPNIAIVQDPSAPMKSLDSVLMKLIVGIGASGVIAGLGLAFLIEWVIDRRISRPAQIRAGLQMPLMLSIPYARSKDGIAKLIGSTDPLEPPPLPDFRLAVAGNGNGSLKSVRSKPAHFIEPFTAAIHDRIVFNFELNNITHKPKLIALTGLSEGAGTSTIATGLAKSFAETSSNKVLLVDLNPCIDDSGKEMEQKTSLRHALEMSRTEQFHKTPRGLFFASASTRRFQHESTALAPIQLREMLPSLVSSGYDYIIFDLPPVDSTSPTIAMAGFMDKVLLVLDASDTTPDRLKWAYSELEKARVDISCVLNKVKSHAPRWIEGDL
jgi:succinoglycan biosynthesis transport protein ExoP